MVTEWTITTVDDERTIRAEDFEWGDGGVAILTTDEKVVSVFAPSQWLEIHRKTTTKTTWTSQKVLELYRATVELENIDGAIRDYEKRGISGIIHDIEHRKMRVEALKKVEDLSGD